MASTRSSNLILHARRSINCSRNFASWSQVPKIASSQAQPRTSAATPSLSAPHTQRAPRALLARHDARRASTTTQPSGIRQSPLHDLHAAHGAKFVPFGGYSMPVQYSDLGVGDSHTWTREKASLFDVSHMVQHHISGPGANAFLSLITPSSIATIENNRSSLSCLLHPVTGGIVDDTVITRLGPEHFYIVTNAGCREKDEAYLTEQLHAFDKSGGAQVHWKTLDGQGLIALQGPLAVGILESVLADRATVNLKELFFGQCRLACLHLPDGKTSSDVLVSRGGYTGEDGFEISVPGEEVTAVAEMLLQTAGNDRLRLAGLGARDSLRLEAGMCLYGHDLDDSTTPVEGGLSWVIGKDRRTEGGFHGAETILRQLKKKSEGGEPPKRRRVGLVVQGAPAREGAEIVDSEGRSVGKITSGCPSPTLKQNIAMGYVKSGQHKAGTELEVVVRGKNRKATVTKMPFVPSKYWKGGASPG